MVYWGLGFLMLAATLVVLATVAGMHGAGGAINIALIASLALLTGAALTSDRPRGRHRAIRVPGL